MSVHYAFNLAGTIISNNMMLSSFYGSSSKFLSLFLLPLVFLINSFFALSLGQLQAHPPLCQPIFVRWPRVRLNSQAVARTAPFGLSACRSACTDGGQHDPTNKIQCSAFNHRTGISSYANECQLFRREHVQHTDGYMEADDRYTFYWKYCVETAKSCAGDYAFTFLSDRYIMAEEVARTKFTRSLEECLAECLNGDDGAMLCRSVSFNRTDGGCHLSEQNQLSKPGAIRVNNNPNFRIDYYENNCYNNSFSFTSTCEPNGIRIRVDSRIPYTGALYGLYDFFSCRIEPKEAKKFEYLFPYPHLAKNCSDSMRQSGSDVLLEVVLSTDGVEPLYFITADDLTYQAKCPLPHRDIKSTSSSSMSIPDKFGTNLQLIGDDPGDVKLVAPKEGASVHSILQALGAVAEPSIRRRFEGEEGTTADDRKKPKPKQQSPATSSSPPPTLLSANANSKSVFTTKDMFTLLPLFTPSSSSSATKQNMQTNGGTPTPTSDSTTPPATTIILLQQKGEECNLATKGRKIGMEPIFDEGEMTTTRSNRKGADEDEKTEEEGEGSTAVTFMQIRTTATSPEPAASTETERPLSLTSEATTTATTNTNNSTIGGGEEERVKTTTKRSASRQEPDNSREFRFSTHLAFPPDRIWMSTGAKESREEGDSANMSTTSTGTTSGSSTTTTTSTPIPPTTPAQTQSTSGAAQNELFGGHPPGGPPSFGGPRRAGTQQQKVIFDIFHNGQPAEAVVVGSRITLAFTPYFAIPPAYMSISGCQVEPIGSLYEWEKEPLAIIKDGCQADHVGLVCPPQKTDYGIRVTVEAFRYQTTTQVQYTCLVRVCPFAPCPQTTCPAVDGCPGDDIVSRTLGLSRARRDVPVAELSLEQIRAALAANPQLQRQLALSAPQPAAPPHGTASSSRHGAPLLADPPLGGNPVGRMSTGLQQQLIMLGGDTLVRRRLIVVNTEEELHYYVKTGEVPRAAGA